ncbi:DNA mismatch repair protein MSH3 [Labeo rohita]|uniref:DNA mismatch repair protein MSH3 n=1 Tax=Labeo rohita TaxID=84645 RepID=A0ABQ8M333_LABRO|nr:DNA mismatch repair protein MSH3 [Labeo rohita]
MNQRKPVRGHQNQLFNPNEIHPNIKPIIQQNVAGDQIHRQKLSCSHLIHFLKTSRKSKLKSELMLSADKVKYRPDTTEASFSLMQHQKTDSTTASVENKIFSEPMFAEKESSVDVSYHWMIATNSELWDIGDIFSQTNFSLPELFQNEMTDFNSQDDTEVSDLSGRSVCSSAGELWCLKESPVTLSHRLEKIPVVISHVRPVNGETWSFEAISWFRSKVQSKTLYARLYPEVVVLVELFMEKGKIGAMRRGDSLSVRLAQK